MEDAKRPQGRASGMMRVKKWQDCHGRRKAPARASIRDDASQKSSELDKAAKNLSTIIPGLLY